VTVVIPTLAADSSLLPDCLLSLERQTFRAFEAIVVDNSGRGAARAATREREATVIENQRNIGFGAAVNQGFRAGTAPFLAVLNDDAAAHPGWLKALMDAIERREDVGMCASQVRLSGSDRLDSAGMLVASDGSSRQRGHGESWRRYGREEEVLFASGSAALFRRRMLEEIGLFDEDFFLYCEDVDLGLRASRAGWKCLYVPGAVVEHAYSRSAGRGTPLKAYYVERNRLFVVVKNFPLPMLVAAPWRSLVRYGWHVVSMIEGRGQGSEFLGEGHGAWRLVWIVIKAHAALVPAWPKLWRRRMAIAQSARLSAREFRQLLSRHAISLRRVAEL